MRAVQGPCAGRGVVDAGVGSRHDVVGAHHSKERLSAPARGGRAGLVVVSLQGPSHGFGQILAIWSTVITFSTPLGHTGVARVEKVINRKLKGNNIHDCHGHPCGQCGRFFLLPGGRGAAQRACNRRNRTFCPLAELSRGEGNFLCIFEPDDPSEAAALAAVHVGRPKRGSWAMDIASRPWLN